MLAKIRWAAQLLVNLVVLFWLFVELGDNYGDYATVLVTFTIVFLLTFNLYMVLLFIFYSKNKRKNILIEMGYYLLWICPLLGLYILFNPIG